MSSRIYHNTIPYHHPCNDLLIYVIKNLSNFHYVWIFADLHKSVGISTIFKNVPSDVNKSGKELEILGKKASVLKQKFDEAGGGIKGFKATFAELARKDFRLNSDGEIITKENIDSFIPKLTNSQANDLAGILVEFDKDNDSLDELLSSYSKPEAKYIEDFVKNTKDLSKVTGEDLVKACKGARQEIIDHNSALQHTSLSSRTAAMGMTLLKTTLNALAFTVVSTAVTAMANAIISNVTDIVNAYEDGVKKISDLSDGVKGLKSEQESLNEKLAESQNRLYELQQIKIPSLFEKDEIQHLKEYNEQLKVQITGFSGKNYPH